MQQHPLQNYIGKHFKLKMYTYMIKQTTEGEFYFVRYNEHSRSFEHYANITHVNSKGVKYFLFALDKLYEGFLSFNKILLEPETTPQP